MTDEEHQVRSTRWNARPIAAGLVRATALGVPVAASVAVVWLASALIPPPSGSLGLYLGWWLGLSALATVVLVAVGRVSRRLLPLAALLRLSLVFPDATPSRFRTAAASGTVASLEDRLADARRGDATPAESAQRLLTLVAALDEHDGLTRGHSERVRAYSLLIGRELGLDQREVELLNWAALLHDIGKLEIPSAILNKRGRPTDDEWTTIRSHPLLGESLVAPLHAWLGDWAQAVVDHHEHWDGGGYPRGLAGNDISLAGRIVAVADVFDVITSTRSYKEASTMAAARAEIARCAGTQFDPEVVRAFLAVSLGTARLAAGPFSWLAQAAVLARTPLTSAGTLSAAAVVGVSVAPGGIVERHARIAAPPRAPAPLVVPASAPAAAPAASGVATPAAPAARGERATPAGAPVAPTKPASGTPAIAPVPADAPPDEAPSAPAAGSGATDGDRTQPARTDDAPRPSTPDPGSKEPSPAKEPDATKLPEVPKLPDAPTLPGTTLPEAPKLPETPKLPDAPALPETPTLPSAPSTPSVPSTPTLPPPPTAPSTPTLPSAPTVPSTPSVPKLP